LQSATYSEERGDSFSLRLERFEELKAKMELVLIEQETLEYMLSVRKQSLMARIQPVNRMRSRLQKLQGDIVIVGNELAHTESQALLLSSAMHETVKSKEDWKGIKTKQVENDLQKYEDREKFAFYLAQEHEKNLELEVLRKSVEERIELKKGLEKQQENEKLGKELRSMEEFILRQEQQFSKIQKSANVTSVSDLVPYYEYLLANEAKLTETVEVALQRIEQLSTVRTELGAELQRIMYSADAESQLSSSDVQTIELKLSERVKALDDDERTLSKHEEVVVAASNIVSRLVPQVCETTDIIDVNPDNLTEHLALCGIKLEQKYNAMLTRNVLYLGESINTVKDTQDIHFNSPPEFLKIASQSRMTAGDVRRITAGDVGRITAGDVRRITAGEVGRMTAGDVRRMTAGL
jgi:hypothetical protein